MAAALVAHTIPAGAARVSVCDPACGDGAILAEVRRRFPHAELFGVDIDPAAVAKAHSRLPDATIACADALARTWQRTFDFILGNPPWVSFSGRHAEPLPRALRDVLQRYETFARWPTLHGPFLELALRLATQRVGYLLPAQVCELDGYGPLRAYIRRHASLVEPLLELGEQAFPGVTQPSCGLVLQRHAERKGSGDSSPFTRPDALPLVLTVRKRAPPGTFQDIGVHSGNCAKKLFDRGGRPIREGRDVMPYALRDARRTFARPYDLGPNEYFRAKDLSIYQSVPIVIRQTASRPIAALHRDPTFFRNSVLACRGIAGVAPELIVAWLNSSAVAWYHRTRVAEASQRAFPQVKLRHLRDLPMPDWTDPPEDLLKKVRSLTRRP
ncbi:MAG: methyltransferase domain-containing protein, partial [Planctomycetota bacterium]|nr:methyltransferase domain-containing protein [Planctomycetota bacterium]